MEETVCLTDRADTFSDCIKAMEALQEKGRGLCVLVGVRSSQLKSLDPGRGRCQHVVPVVIQWSHLSVFCQVKSVLFIWSNIPSLPQEALQSVQHLTPAIHRPPRPCLQDLTSQIPRRGEVRMITSNTKWTKERQEKFDVCLLQCELTSRGSSCHSKACLKALSWLPHSALHLSRPLV